MGGPRTPSRDPGRGHLDHGAGAPPARAVVIVAYNVCAPFGLFTITF